MRKPKAYVASPYGFSEGGRYFYEHQFLPCIKGAGFDIIDPWKFDLPAEMCPYTIAQLQAMPISEEKCMLSAVASRIIGGHNDMGIEECQILIGGLDGPDVDSGTACEIGVAAGLGRAIEAYRSDFRLSSDSIGTTVNLQVEYFIRRQGGMVHTSLEALEKRLFTRYQTLK